MTTPLDGPPPTWREGYLEDEPAYRETVRAMGIPGLDRPTGGDVVQGEVQPDTELPGMWAGSDLIGGETDLPVSLIKGEKDA